MAQIDDLQAYVNFELPRRSVLFTEASLGVTGDPNTGIHPSLDSAPGGTFFLDNTAPDYDLWRKKTSSPTSWEVTGSGGGGDSVVSADLDLYVDPINGLDTNDGLSKLTPLLTWSAVTSKIGKIIGDGIVVTIHGFSGGLLITSPLVLAANFGHIIIIGDGDGAADGDITQNTTIVASGTLTAANNTAGIMTMAGGLTEDDHFGLSWVATSGDAVGYRRIISYNSTDSYHFGIGMQSAPQQVAIGDTYDVSHSDFYLDFASDGESNPIIISGDENPTEITNSLQPSVVFMNLGIRGIAGSDVVAYPQLLGGTYNMYGVHLDRTTDYVGLQVTGGHLMAGVDNGGYTAQLPVDMGFVADAHAWRGWGIGLSNTGAGLQYSFIIGGENSYVSAYGVVGSISARYVVWLGGAFWSQQGFGNQFVPVTARHQYLGFGFPSKMMRIKADTGDALTIAGTVTTLDRPWIESTTGDAIVVQRGGHLNNYLGLDPLSTSLALGSGLRVEWGGQARINPFWNPSLLGGTTGWFIDGFSLDPNDRGDGSAYPSGTRFTAEGGTYLEIFS